MSTPVIDEPSERIPFSNLPVLQAVAVIAQMHDTSCSAGHVHPLKAPECSDVHLRFNWIPMGMEPLKLHGIEAWLRFDTRQWICLRQGSVFYLRRRDDAPPGLSHPEDPPANVAFYTIVTNPA